MFFCQTFTDQPQIEPGWSDDRDRVQARVIRDSLSPQDIRLTTLEVTIHRFVLAELNTHRAFSRNSESSRAVPFHKRVSKAHNYPAVPLIFPQEQSGMQGGAPVTDRYGPTVDWLVGRDAAVAVAERMASRNVHKSVVNRVLEPYLWHTVVITATEWEGFFTQRDHHMAQPEIWAAARCMRAAMDASSPVIVDYGGWHLPFIQDRDVEEAFDGMLGDVPGALDVLKRVSAARCARTSYVTHDGVRDLDKDLALYERLAKREPGEDDPHHWSPLEHVATPCEPCRPREGADFDPATARAPHVHPGNFRGWFQHRHELDRSPYT